MKNVSGKQGEPTKDQYDFSKGERAKFYHPGAVFRLPVNEDESAIDSPLQKLTDQGVS